MNKLHEKIGLWYTRRGGVVRGPFPHGQISRCILLGRLTEDDEVRFEFGDWKPVVQCPDLIPDVMKLPPNKENLQKLMMARMHEDERRPLERREDGNIEDDGVSERRFRDERRQQEPEMFQRHRELKHRVAERDGGTPQAYRYPVFIAVMVLLAFALTWTLRQPAELENAPDCRAIPRPGVNWDNCSFSGVSALRADLRGASIRNAQLNDGILEASELSGARFDYSNLSGSILRDSNLAGAVLIGADLSGADLSGVNFTGADLSYANLADARLGGARFDGARLDYAIWIDRTECGAGSLGNCKRP